MAREGTTARVTWRALRRPALACVGLVAFVATSPAFPLTHGVLDYVAPDLTSRAFMTPAAVTTMLLAVAVAWRLFSGRAPVAVRPSALLACGAAHLAAYALALALYGTAASAGFAVPPLLAGVAGCVCGLGLSAGFFAWWLALPLAGLHDVSFAGTVRVLAVVVALAVGAERAIEALPAGVAAGVVLALVAVAAVAPGAMALLAPAGGEGIPAQVTGAALYDAILPVRPGAPEPAAERGAGERGEHGAPGDGLVEESATLRAPAFFLGLPLAVFLLYAASFAGLVPTRVDGELPGFAPAALVACLVLVATSAIRGDARVAAVTFRLLLPLAGVAVLGVSTVAPDDVEVRVVSLGAQGMCYAYGILALALVTYAGARRLGGLIALAACVTSFAASVVMMLPYYDVTLGSLTGYVQPFVVCVLVVALGFLAASPSLVLWQDMFRLVDRPAAPEETFEDKMRQACDRLAAAYGLTPRETEVLQYLGRGYGPAYIASVLPIKENTIRSHVRNIYGKTNVSSRGELLELVDGFAAGDVTRGT